MSYVQNEIKENDLKILIQILEEWIHCLVCRWDEKSNLVASSEVFSVVPTMLTQASRPLPSERSGAGQWEV